MTTLGEALLELAVKPGTPLPVAARVCRALGNSPRWDNRKSSRSLSVHLHRLHDKPRIVVNRPFDVDERGAPSFTPGYARRDAAHAKQRSLDKARKFHRANAVKALLEARK